VREVDFVLPCGNVLRGLRGLRFLLVFILRRLGLPLMKVLGAHLKGSDGCSISTERPPPAGVMRTFGWHRRSGGPAGLREFSFRIRDI
jgi:hypothetical protein